MSFFRMGILRIHILRIHILRLLHDPRPVHREYTFSDLYLYKLVGECVYLYADRGKCITLCSGRNNAEFGITPFGEYTWCLPNLIIISHKLTTILNIYFKINIKKLEDTIYNIWKSSGHCILSFLHGLAFPVS